MKAIAKEPARRYQTPIGAGRGRRPPPRARAGPRESAERRLPADQVHPPPPDLGHGGRRLDGRVADGDGDLDVELGTRTRDRGPLPDPPHRDPRRPARRGVEPDPDPRRRERGHHAVAARGARAGRAGGGSAHARRALPRADRSGVQDPGDGCGPDVESTREATATDAASRDPPHRPRTRGLGPRIQNGVGSLHRRHRRARWLAARSAARTSTPRPKRAARPARVPPPRVVGSRHRSARGSTQCRVGNRAHARDASSGRAVRGRRSPPGQAGRSRRGRIGLGRVHQALERAVDGTHRKGLF
jgi:hypothetical protein